MFFRTIDTLLRLNDEAAIQTLNLGQLGFFQKALQLLNNLPTL